jgi:signal peptidase II
MTMRKMKDFLNVGVGWLRTGIFNVADMAIMLALLLMVCDGARRRMSSTGDERAG